MKTIRWPSVFPVAFLLLCGLSLAACSNGDSKISWEQDKESVTRSIQVLDDEQKKEAAAIKGLLAAADSRLQSLEALSKDQQAQIEALSAQLEEQKRIEAEKQIEEQKRIHADELKKAEAQKRKRLALQRAKRTAAAAKKKAERKQLTIPPELATTTFPAAVTEKMASAATVEKNAYTAAYLALKSGRFDEASKAFNEQLDMYPNGEYADQAWYWLGETRYAQQAYGMATNAFKYVVNNYPKSVKYHTALLKLGQIAQVLNRNHDAIEYYNRLINEYGDSNAAKQARAALAKMQNIPGEKQP